MKKFLRIVSLLLAVVIMTSALPAMADDGKVEIGFSVGDEILTINGEEVKVEKPYVVGDGVTLVPVRVITEAFGADVGWIPESKTITLSYPEVEIVLQIGNPTADVNGKAETLLSAPELSKNGVTMVPLRFISENFGADVGWDDATKRITVTKGAASGEQSIIGSSTDAARIGDSYYGWSMDNSAEVSMTDRTFDEMETEFSFNDKNSVGINVWHTDEDYDFEKSYNDYKSTLKGYTLVAAEKDDSNPKLKYMHFQAKDKEVFIDCREYATEEYVYEVYGLFDNTDSESVKKGTELLGSFRCEFNPKNTYDLSTVKDGFRKYKAEEMKFEINVPATFGIYGGENLENEITFMPTKGKNLVSMGVTVYSKSSVVDAKTVAEKDYAGNKDAINPKYVTFSDSVYEVNYKGFSGYEYSYEMRYINNYYIKRDAFYELGDYVYNIHVGVATPNDKAEEELTKIMDSFKAEKLDSNLVGVLMRNTADSDGTYVAKGSVWTMRVPNSYEEVTSSDTGLAITNERRGVLVAINSDSAIGYDFRDLREAIRETVEDTARNNPSCEVVQPVKVFTQNDIKYVDCIISETNIEGEKMYVRYLSGMKDGKIVTFVVTYHEIGRTDSLMREIDEMIQSFRFKFV